MLMHIWLNTHPIKQQHIPVRSYPSKQIDFSFSSLIVSQATTVLCCCIKTVVLDNIWSHPCASHTPSSIYVVDFTYSTRIFHFTCLPGCLRKALVVVFMKTNGLAKWTSAAATAQACGVEDSFFCLFNTGQWWKYINFEIMGYAG